MQEQKVLWQLNGNFGFGEGGRGGVTHYEV